jgi:hypothetical protein
MDHLVHIIELEQLKSRKIKATRWYGVAQEQPDGSSGEDQSRGNDQDQESNISSNDTVDDEGHGGGSSGEEGPMSWSEGPTID